MHHFGNRLEKSAVAALALTLVACGYQKDVVVTRAQVQELLDKKFPVEKGGALSKVTLRSPEVSFPNSEIGLRLQYDVDLPGKAVAGQVALHGAPTYRPEEGAFYLSTVAIDEVTLNSEALSHHDKLRALVSSVLTNAVPHIPVYRLQQQDFKHSLAKLLLKKIRIEGENLVLTMGL